MIFVYKQQLGYHQEEPTEDKYSLDDRSLYKFPFVLTPGLSSDLHLYDLLSASPVVLSVGQWLWLQREIDVQLLCRTGRVENLPESL